MTLNMQRLRVFLAVVDHGGVSAAARALNTAQSSVSAAMSQLETEVNAPLLHRSGRRFQLTEAGNALVSHGRALMLAIDESLDAVARARDAPVGGVLTVGATTTAAERALPRALAGLLSVHPDVDVDVRIAATADVVDRVLDGTLPFAIIAGTTGDPRLLCEPLAEEEQTVIISPTHLLAGRRADPSALRGSRLLLREQGSATREFQLRLAEQWRIPRLQQSTLTGSSAILAAVSHGLGFTCLSTSVVDVHLRAGAVARIELPVPLPTRTISLVRLPHRRFSLIEDLFLSELKKDAPA
ncbi:LysR family transcriptional regulator [Microbacterium sp. NPDC091313]